MWWKFKSLEGKTGLESKKSYCRQESSQNFISCIHFSIMKETLRIRLLLGASYYAGGVLALFYCFMISVTFSQLEGNVNLFACVISTCTLLLHMSFRWNKLVARTPIFPWNYPCFVNDPFMDQLMLHICGFEEKYSGSCNVFFDPPTRHLLLRLSLRLLRFWRRIRTRPSRSSFTNAWGICYRPSQWLYDGNTLHPTLQAPKSEGSSTEVAFDRWHSIWRWPICTFGDLSFE